MAELDVVKALKLAESLKGVPGFPWDKAAVDAMVKDLVRWCKGFVANPPISPEEQAEWLIAETRDLSVERWIGPGAMKKLLLDKYPPAKPPGPEYQVHNLGEKPVIVCTICNDLGTVRQPNGRHRFCECASGEYNRTEFGNSWLDFCDGKRTVKTLDIPPPEYHPGPGADERPYPPVDERTGRCIQCNGWGKSAGCYCSCQLGRDLEKVERQTAARLARLAEENGDGSIQ